VAIVGFGGRLPSLRGEVTRPLERPGFQIDGVSSVVATAAKSATYCCA
jgi:hypothetical protein